MKRIEGLSEIEFTGARSVAEYSKEARNICRDLAREFEFSADDIEGALIASQKGNAFLALLGGPDVKLRARRVSKRLRRAAELAQGAATEAVKLNAQFRREFADILNPPKTNKRSFDFKDD